MSSSKVRVKLSTGFIHKGSISVLVLFLPLESLYDMIMLRTSFWMNCNISLFSHQQFGPRDNTFLTMFAFIWD